MTFSDLRIGHTIIKYDQVDSTNAEARRLLDHGKATHGTVITAHFQTSGRGQFGRTWNSTKGQNVMMTVVLVPENLKVDKQFDLNLCVSLAVAHVLNQYTGGVKVKWPNDIYVHKSKICGILIQNFIQADRINQSIVGIGLNVNQEHWPEEVTNATSLFLESGQSHDVSLITKEICTSLDTYFPSISLKKNTLKEQYLKHLLHINEEASFRHDDQLFRGIIVGIDNIGRLLVKHKEGIDAFSHGSITQIIDQ